MKPKDLLEYLEKGDRTMEDLTKTEVPWGLDPLNFAFASATAQQLHMLREAEQRASEELRRVEFMRAAQQLPTVGDTVRWRQYGEGISI